MIYHRTPIQKQKMPSRQVVTEPSICIPRTLYNVNWQTVKYTFEGILGKGTVDRVDIVPCRDQDQFCKIFVHFRYWPDTETANNIRARLNDGEMVKMVYDPPYFWKCSASRVAKPTWEPKSKPYFVFDYNRSSKPHSLDDDQLKAYVLSAPLIKELHPHQEQQPEQQPEQQQQQEVEEEV